MTISLINTVQQEIKNIISLCIINVFKSKSFNNLVRSEIKSPPHIKSRHIMTIHNVIKCISTLPIYLKKKEKKIFKTRYNIYCICISII